MGGPRAPRAAACEGPRVNGGGGGAGGRSLRTPTVPALGALAALLSAAWGTCATPPAVPRLRGRPGGHREPLRGQDRHGVPRERARCVPRAEAVPLPGARLSPRTQGLWRLGSTAPACAVVAWPRCSRCSRGCCCRCCCVPLGAAFGCVPPPSWVPSCAVPCVPACSVGPHRAARFCSCVRCAPRGTRTRRFCWGPTPGLRWTSSTACPASQSGSRCGALCTFCRWFASG